MTGYANHLGENTMKNYRDTHKRRMGKKSLAILALFLCLISMAFSFLILKGGAEASEKETSFALTQEEQEKLSLIPEREITIGYAKASEYSRTEEGIEYGLLVPVKKFLENELDFQVKMVLQGKMRFWMHWSRRKSTWRLSVKRKKKGQGFFFLCRCMRTNYFTCRIRKGKNRIPDRSLDIWRNAGKRKTLRTV